jgi:hypothetical protein
MLELEPRTRPNAPPAKSWRNYYRVYRVLHLGRVGHWFPGIHAGPDAFPSKEIAETCAQSFLTELNVGGRVLMEHAGAFPEGDRPN